MIYYKRIANDCDEFDAYDMLTQKWMSVDDNGIGNILNEDFLLTTNEEVANNINIQSLAQCNGQCWDWCTYGDDGYLPDGYYVGGFRACGPVKGGGWNFYCTQEPLCKSVRWTVI